MRTAVALILFANLCPAAAGDAKTPTAAASLTAAQIVDRSIQATGGRTARERFRTTYARGTIESGDGKSTIEFYAKAPDKRLIVMNIEGFGEIRTGFDGQTGWSQDPDRGRRELEGPELERVREEALFQPELKWREMYPKAELLGKVQVGTRAAYKVRLTPGKGGAITRYYDTTTFLLLRQDSKQATPKGPVVMTTMMSDYRDVGGMKAPFVIRQIVPTGQMTIRIEEMRNNLEIEDAKFRP